MANYTLDIQAASANQPERVKDLESGNHVRIDGECTEGGVICIANIQEVLDECSLTVPPGSGKKLKFVMTLRKQWLDDV